jgi:hypothetical protein
VADRACAEIDLRPDTDEAERAIARMREIAERPRVAGTTSRFSGAELPAVAARPPGNGTARDHARGGREIASR